MNLISALHWILLAAVAAAAAYSIIALCGVIRFLAMRRKNRAEAKQNYTPPISVLKPLHGLDRELKENIESFCLQDYPEYEILFSVREESDPAVAVVRELEKKYPQVRMWLLVIGQPKYLNAKVHSLEKMAEAAAHDIWVINDSDVRVMPDYLRSVVGPMEDPRTGLVTCLSRGVAGNSLWSALEALSMNLQFLPGVLAAWLLEDLKFSLGPTMVTRKARVKEIGGFGRLGDYLADDFVLGEFIAQAGYRVVLSSHIPEHLVCNETMKSSLRHRLRWERSSRRSRPAGYFGQVFMHSLPLALLAGLLVPAGNPAVMPLVAICLTARAALVWMTAVPLLNDSAFRRYWWLTPIQDLVGFAIWCWGIFGKEIEWRGARFRVLKGGKLEAAKN